MTELLTSAQMRAIEAAAIASGQVSGLELMERAGQSVVEAVFEAWPDLQKAPHRAVVLCGPGNNGGDGFVVARLLKDWGWAVEVFLYGDPEKLPPDAKINHARWRRVGDVLPLADDQFDGRFDAQSTEAIVVDAIFGTGLTRPFPELPHVSMALNAAQSQASKGGLPKIVAIDVPSGMCADSGRWLGNVQSRDSANLANLTVTFHATKRGHVLDDGPHSCGKVVVKDIGLRGGSHSSVAETVESIDLPELWTLAKSSDHNKFMHGHALVLSGGFGKSGAARLAARGALRIGAGLVSVAAPEDAMTECAAQLTAIMLQQVDTPADLNVVLQDNRINALCIGPGLGLSDESPKLLAEGLKSARPTVIDADALTLIGRDAALFALLHSNCVLTPHGGEFARVFPDIAEKLNAPATKGPAYSKVDATREAAKRAGCVVLFKGPDTVIASPDGRCALNAAVYDRAAPWLATAGSGDVLAGFVTGLLARGLDPMMAAKTGAWLHVECGREFGPGLIAEDLPEMLPQVLRRLGA